MTRYIFPPPGWYDFGTHIDQDVPLEFSHRTGEDGLPLWERPILHDLGAHILAGVFGAWADGCPACGPEEPQEPISGPTTPDLGESLDDGLDGPQ